MSGITQLTVNSRGINIFDVVVMNVKFVLHFDFYVVFECGQPKKNFVVQ